MAVNKQVVDGVEVVLIGLEDVTEQETQHYVDYVRERTTEPLKKRWSGVRTGRSI